MYICTIFWSFLTVFLIIISQIKHNLNTYLRKSLKTYICIYVYMYICIDFVFLLIFPLIYIFEMTKRCIYIKYRKMLFLCSVLFVEIFQKFVVINNENDTDFGAFDVWNEGVCGFLDENPDLFSLFTNTLQPKRFKCPCWRWF